MQMLTNVQPLILTIALLMRLVKTPLVHIPVHATVAILGVETCAPVSHHCISFKTIGISILMSVIGRWLDGCTYFTDNRSVMFNT